ncbi:ScbA/BarX family gamma-butyrolactone biosynthesis protein [Streptomyces sp. 1222.5]|uniref:ScbA/BarX family gamma-butyrolactone biosynthesis protein n=1 Tax=Streptomyces sp. 1222.5 TaxID=1881026 RepID=UPI003D742494
MTTVRSRTRQKSRHIETDILPAITIYPVHRELVHRSNPVDVLPTGWRVLAKDRFVISVAWPVDHPFYTRVNGKHSANLIGETIRQCGLLLAHAAYDVPLGHHFVMWDMTYTREAGPADGDRAVHHLEVEVTCSDLRFRGTRLGAMTCDMTLRADGETVAQGGGRFDIVSPAAYRRLRGTRMESGARPAEIGAAQARSGGSGSEPPSVSGAGLEPPGASEPVQPDPVPPETVGRTRVIDVLLAPAHTRTDAAPTDRWQLRADFGHPTLFDHPNDHFPGMVLLEAAFQAANAAVAPGLLHHHTAAKVAFLGYVEYSTPCWIEARATTAGSPLTAVVEITARQNDRLVFTALLEGTAVPAPLEGTSAQG